MFAPFYVVHTACTLEDTHEWINWTISSQPFFTKSTSGSLNIDGQNNRTNSTWIVGSQVRNCTQDLNPLPFLFMLLDLDSKTILRTGANLMAFPLKSSGTLKLNNWLRKGREAQKISELTRILFSLCLEYVLWASPIFLLSTLYNISQQTMALARDIATKHFYDLQLDFTCRDSSHC